MRGCELRGGSDYAIRVILYVRGGMRVARDARSAGCPLGRFSHWWRSESEPVFGEGGFHTSSALTSTVLLGHL
jgi:hypothetical protein